MPLVSAIVLTNFWLRSILSLRESRRTICASHLRLFFVKQLCSRMEVIRQNGTEVAFHESMRINDDVSA
jgi:hypothetical protein